MLQNRVDPFGHLIRTPARGTLMGNRGVLHDARQEILRQFRLKAWITCTLEFKDRSRKVMMADRWTELFFLDEATAFAAGHRPCFECRRERANAFKSAWLAGNPEYGFSDKVRIGEIDAILHGERIDRAGNKVRYRADVRELPDGVFVAVDDRPYLVSNGALRLWTPFGYEGVSPFPPRHTVDVLTPNSVVQAFKAGYKVGIALQPHNN